MRAIPVALALVKLQLVPANTIRWRPAVAPVLAAAPRFASGACSLSRSQAVRMSTSSLSSGPRHTNKLAGETSPYLLQHAHNPVNWYPWGDEALQKAKAEDKVIFLSVGYSTCHWCHVMEKESFESERVAAVLNQHFVPIKVDREERPDVDAVYMRFVLAISGGGGWPMSVWLTPALEPFAGGTYYPEDAFIRVLNAIASKWAADKEDIRRRGQTIIQQLGESVTEERAAKGDLEALISTPQAVSAVRTAVNALGESYDEQLGGFADGGRGIKFPQPNRLELLLTAHQLLSKAPEAADRALGTRALRMALHTLDCMAVGGINDHISGGFARYSTDRRWHVPHFEKMLYDNSQLANTYMEAYQVTGDDKHRLVAESILEYVLRDMTSPEGGFYSAQDADSFPHHGATRMREGAFCVWTFDDVCSLLDAKGEGLPTADGGTVPLSRVFCAMYGVKEGGNCDPSLDPHGELVNQNVLYQATTTEKLICSLQLQCDADTVNRALDGARATLLQARAARPAPRLDDKVVTSWNGLMVGALARAAQAEPDEGKRHKYLGAATRAAAFLHDNLYAAETHTLYRSYRAGKRSAVEAFADDHAFLIKGLLDLYDADPYSIRWLEWAEQLQEEMDKRFMAGMEQGGGYYTTTGVSADILLRLKDSSDGAEPSAMSIAASNLWRLRSLTGYARDATHPSHENLNHLLARPIQDRIAPLALPALVCALAVQVMGESHVVIAGAKDAADMQALLRAAQAVYLPCRVLVVNPTGEGGAEAAVRGKFAGLLESYGGCPQVGGKATAYVCRRRTCSLPVTDADKLDSMLRDAAMGGAR